VARKIDEWCYPGNMLYYPNSAVVCHHTSANKHQHAAGGPAGLAAADSPLPAFVWLYLDTGDVQKVAGLSSDIFWLVLPSLPLFLVLPLLLKMGWGFWLSLALSVLVSAACYGVMLLVFKQYAVQP
jgi:hypothetical protein